MSYFIKIIPFNLTLEVSAFSLETIRWRFGLMLHDYLTKFCHQRCRHIARSVISFSDSCNWNIVIDSLSLGIAHVEARWFGYFPISLGMLRSMLPCNGALFLDGSHQLSVSFTRKLLPRSLEAYPQKLGSFSTKALKLLYRSLEAFPQKPWSFYTETWKLLHSSLKASPLKLGSFFPEAWNLLPRSFEAFFENLVSFFSQLGSYSPEAWKLFPGCLKNSSQKLGIFFLEAWKLLSRSSEASSQSLEASPRMLGSFFTEAW